ncbi:MAG TPA: GNAT family protein [Stellaceae bacterium]|nr:GNAT family protein [Stellaceae bacterium]
MKNAYLTYRPIVEDDAGLLLRWRTAPEISRFMLTEVSSDPARQREWLRASAGRSDMIHRIMQVHDHDIGYCSIKVVDADAGVGTVGVYVGESGTPTALTAFNFIHILNHAFCAMGLHKIVNHILAINDRLLPAQKFNGYRHVGVLKEHAVKAGHRFDMHIFEQMASEWLEFRRRFGDWRDLDGTLWPPSDVVTADAATADTATGAASGKPLPVAAANSVLVSGR